MTKKRRPAGNRERRQSGKSAKPMKVERGDVLLERLGKPRRFWLIASIVVLAAAFFSVGFYRVEAGAGYPLDDTWIHLAFARNLASGSGFGANPNEPTPGATSPLWVLLLAPGFLFGMVHDTWPWILAMIVLGAAGIMSSALVLALVREGVQNVPPWVGWLALLCGITVVWTAPLVWSTAGAMEVSLFVALICASLLVFTTRSTRTWRSGLAWGVLAGATALARPEGLLLAPILALVSLWRFKRDALAEVATGVLTAAVVYSPSVIFCLATTGFIFPNTFYAKTTALVAGAPSVKFLVGVVKVLGEISPVSLCAFFIGIAGALVVVLRRRNMLGLTATLGFAVGLPVAYAAMGRTDLFAPFAGNFGRYLYPLLPPLLVLGFWAVAHAMLTFPRRPVLVTGIILVLLSPLVSAIGTVKKVELYRHNVLDVNTMQVAMALSLRDKLESNDLVAANDVGALAYFTDLRVLDLFGIVSTKTLLAVKPAEMEPNALTRAHHKLLLQERPAALVIFPPWFDGTLRWLGPIAKPIEVINHESNITSPWPRLVAYKLTWPKG